MQRGAGAPKATRLYKLGLPWIARGLGPSVPIVWNPSPQAKAQTLRPAHPAEAGDAQSPVKVKRPSLSSCHSCLLPYANQQDLLNSREKEYLQSQKMITVTDLQRVRDFTGEMVTGFPCEMPQDGPVAHVRCYSGRERLASRTVHSSTIIQTEDRQRYRYADGLQSLRRMTPEMRQYDSRIRCADNLRRLWRRLHWYHPATARGAAGSSGAPEQTYPPAAAWCAATTVAYARNGSDYSVREVYQCPSAGEGECHYAMNPNCTPDAPADTVLLFETKGGWNQHGGPELFTFDNHDPKGGLVLLNDGTVKFIRTEEELQQLRWR
jgi:hypothetical protein